MPWSFNHIQKMQSLNTMRKQLKTKHRCIKCYFSFLSSDGRTEKNSLHPFLFWYMSLSKWIIARTSVKEWGQPRSTCQWESGDLQNLQRIESFVKELICSWNVCTRNWSYFFLPRSSKLITFRRIHRGWSLSMCVWIFLLLSDFPKNIC